MHSRPGGRTVNPCRTSSSCVPPPLLRPRALGCQRWTGCEATWPRPWCARWCASRRSGRRSRLRGQRPNPAGAGRRRGCPSRVADGEAAVLGQRGGDHVLPAGDRRRRGRLLRRPLTARTAAHTRGPGPSLRTRPSPCVVRADSHRRARRPTARTRSGGSPLRSRTDSAPYSAGNARPNMTHWSECRDS